MTAHLSNPAAAKEPRRTWYGLQIWRNRRAHQLRIEPLCQLCLKAGKTTAAVVADHIEDHHGNWNCFRLGELQSLCEACHERKHGRLGPAYRGSKEVDANGFPVDPHHPFNKGAALKARR